MRDEHPGPAEETLPFQFEEILVVVDVRGDHPAPNITEDILEGAVVIGHGSSHLLVCITEEYSAI